MARGALTAAAAIFFLVGLVIFAWNVRLPFIAYSPGLTTDATNSVRVDGADVYKPAGELVMLTVAGQDINAFEALVASADQSVDLYAREVLRRPEETDEDYRRRNLELMDASTQTAVGVALAHLEVADLPPRVFVTGYAADTPAGALIEIGDRVVELDGVEVEVTDDLQAAMADNAPGDRVAMTVERQGHLVPFEVELSAFEDDAERPFIGIFVRQLPFWVDIDSGIVGGPSAGLMYTLAIIDVLTPEDLTHGNVVAGTGAVDADGNVGAVGGVRQKVVAAEAAGAAYMLVPQANYEAAQTAPRTSLELVPVATVDEALEFLNGLSEV
ncbi:PDZ domain-containing protein [soil metagenome]